MDLATATILLASVLIPTKTWFAPNQPLSVQVKAATDVTLLLTDFSGRPIEGQGSPDVAAGERVVDLRQMFPPVGFPGTYVLYAVPREASTNRDFAGTPLVLSVRADTRRGAPIGAMVTKVEPLAYGVIETAQGPMTVGFYYDVAPNTVNSFISLAQGGFFDGLTFHRVVPNFVIQSGDPRGDGTGGPGYNVAAEFNDRKHEEGVLSMARSGDPNEAPGVPPRPEFANSAGSQFFICLNYENTQQLDGRYTAFGKVVGGAGVEAARQIGQTPVADPATGRPEAPQVIQKVSIKPVTAKENPYVEVQKSITAPPQVRSGATQPATQPVVVPR